MTFNRNDYLKRRGSASSIPGGGVVESIVPGDGIAVDNTDPANPIISATGGSGGEILSPVMIGHEVVTTMDGNVLMGRGL